MNNTSTGYNVVRKCPVCGKSIFADGEGRYHCYSCGYDEVTLPNTIVQTDEPGTVEVGSPAGMYGWICPKCGAVMSPWTSTCPNCTQSNWIVTCESKIDSNYRPGEFNLKESLGHE